MNPVLMNKVVMFKFSTNVSLWEPKNFHCQDTVFKVLPSFKAYTQGFNALTNSVCFTRWCLYLITIITIESS